MSRWPRTRAIFHDLLGDRAAGAVAWEVHAVADGSVGGSKIHLDGRSYGTSDSDGNFTVEVTATPALSTAHYLLLVREFNQTWRFQSQDAAALAAFDPATVAGLDLDTVGGRITLFRRIHPTGRITEIQHSRGAPGEPGKPGVRASPAHRARRASTRSRA